MINPPFSFDEILSAKILTAQWLEARQENKLQFLCRKLDLLISLRRGDESKQSFISLDCLLENPCSFLNQLAEFIDAESSGK